MMSAFIGLICGCSRHDLDKKTAAQIITAFYVDAAPEPLLSEGLVKAGRGIVPYLCVEISNKNMPKRGYAILALGEIGDTRAIQTLKDILENETEPMDVRSDALRAIWHIDRLIGDNCAKILAGKSREVDRIIKLLQEDKI